MLYTKSTAAYHLNCQNLVSERGGYFWTFTFREVLNSDEGAMYAWQLFHLAWLRFFDQTFWGVRVVEVHPGGHGLHFHVIISERVSVDITRRIAQRYGFGRVHVVKCNQGAVAYLAKYLTKEDGFPKGVRKWACFGERPHVVRVRDIEVESEFHTNLRACQRALKVEQMHYGFVLWVYAQTQRGEDFRAIKSIADVQPWLEQQVLASRNWTKKNRKAKQGQAARVWRPCWICRQRVLCWRDDERSIPVCVNHGGGGEWGRAHRDRLGLDSYWPGLAGSPVPGRFGTHEAAN